MKNTRGPKTYKFSCAQIGELVGVKARTVSQHIKDGLFDPEDLGSLVDYIVERRAQAQEQAELAPFRSRLEEKAAQAGPLPTTVLAVPGLEEMLDDGDGLLCMTCKEPACDCQLDLFEGT